jgi:hypothetical protein
MTLILDRNTITCKKSLKIPKGKSDAVNRWTDNAMTPKEKVQTTIYKTVDRKQKISQTTRGELRCSLRFLLHMLHPSCYSCYTLVDKSRTLFLVSKV